MGDETKNSLCLIIIIGVFVGLFFGVCGYYITYWYESNINLYNERKDINWLLKQDIDKINIFEFEDCILKNNKYLCFIKDSD